MAFTASPKAKTRTAAWSCSSIADHTTDREAVAIEATPAAAETLFGARLSLVARYAELLVGAGVTRGLIGPREPERLWSRHLLNCAVVTELFPSSTRVVDVGSGAGLPGIVIALRRPDVSVDLLEPLQRRVDFLAEVIEALDLGTQVRVTRGRAEDQALQPQLGNAPWVIARAVAPLDRLVGWCLPLLAPGGQLAAVKGANASAELDEHAPTLRRLGVADVRIVECGVGLVEPAVNVVVVTRPRTRRHGNTRRRNR